MLPWIVLQHVPWEGPGLIADGIVARGWSLETRRLDRGDAIPAPGSFAGLVVMGGPMGVYEATQYPFLARECDLLADAVAAGVPVLGVCLGAQLLAAALGAEVAPGPVPEIGEGSVTLTADGYTDPVLGGDGERIPVVHWHQDTFPLPAGAVRLAGSDLYSQQAFCAGRAAYGLQFHCELTPALVAAWRPRLPLGTTLGDPHLALVAASGHRLIGRFLDRAAVTR